MKITLLAITALAVATTAPLALAQDTELSPTPAPTPEATASDPSVSVTTEKTASPSPTATSSPAATKPSSPPPKSSPTETTSPAAVMPVKKSTPEATIKEIEDKWVASVMTHDPSVAQEYLADDFRGISSRGKVMTKSNVIAEMKKDTDTYTSAKNSKMNVRVFGGQFAVATGISTEVGKATDGKDFKRSFRWTDVWVLRNGKWQCVASQAMLVK